MSDISHMKKRKMIQMFKFELAEETPLPRWLTAQAAAAAPVQSERARLLKEESNDNEKKTHRRARTCMIALTLLLTMTLLVALILLVAQALSAVTSARDSVGAKVALLWNVTEEAALSTKASINSLRGVSQRAELFSATSFDDLANATRHVHSMAEFIDSASHRPVSLSLVGR